MPAMSALPSSTVDIADSNKKPSKDWFNWLKGANDALYRLWRPAASVTPGVTGELVIEATSNTSLTFKYKGSDGTVRSGSLTLS